MLQKYEKVKLFKAFLEKFNKLGILSGKNLLKGQALKWYCCNSVLNLTFPLPEYYYIQTLLSVIYFHCQTT